MLASPGNVFSSICFQLSVFYSLLTHDSKCDIVVYCTKVSATVESKEQSSQRRMRSKGAAHESAGRDVMAVSSVDLMPAAAKLSKRARKGSCAAVVTAETDEQVSIENEPKKGISVVKFSSVDSITAGSLNSCHKF